MQHAIEHMAQLETSNTCQRAFEIMHIIIICTSNGYGMCTSKMQMQRGQATDEATSGGCNKGKTGSCNKGNSMNYYEPISNTCMLHNAVEYKHQPTAISNYGA